LYLNTDFEFLLLGKEEERLQSSFIMANTSFKLDDNYLQNIMARESIVLGVTLLVGAGVLLFYGFNLVLGERHGYKAPVVGRRYYFEPGWLLGLRFVHGSRSIIRDGYEKVMPEISSDLDHPK
jgi:hypothetical protein